jgi:multiple sugar transport system ATP-binding protein
VRGEIRAMHGRSRTTSVYVTHDQVEAMTMGDRIVVLRGGRIEQAGTPVELYERPRNRFVAGFIGSPAMNFCELPLQREAGQAFVVFGDTRLALPGELAGARERIVLGIRPEHLHVGTLPGDAAVLPAEVLSLEFTGAQSSVALRTAAGPLALCAADRPPLAPGDKTLLGVAAGRLHFFDPESGLRLAAGACAS